MRPDDTSSRRSAPASRARRPHATIGAGSDARSRAFAALVRAARTFPEELPETIDESGLDPRDSALAHAILDGAVRHWALLEFLLSVGLRRPFGAVEIGVRGALLGGAAQIAVLERVPVHAAIDTCVEWVKRAVRPGAGALVNAALRRVAELVLHAPGGSRVVRERWTDACDEVPTSDGAALVLAQAVLPPDPLERLAIVTGHPRWLLERWRESFGADAARTLAHHSLSRPPTVLNAAHASPSLDPLSVPGLVAHSSPGSVVAHLSRSKLLALLRSRRDLWVQDAASALAVRSVADLRPRVVVDWCAGRGTKTRQLAMTFPDAIVLACDPDPDRARALADAADLHSNVRVNTADWVRAEARARADLILLDVPCSNTGVLARRAAAKHRCGPDQLARLVAVQRAIVRAAREMLAPGGAILYSTCSLDTEENRGVACAAADELGLRVRSERFTLPAGTPGGADAAYHDGSYSAVLA